MRKSFNKISAAKISNGAYDPKKVEDRIYRLWEGSGFFNPDKLPGLRPPKRATAREGGK
ncbi:MAG: hypothetical protein HYT42_01455 [Candidatus Sungbacteria bacterium]|nr:hypothetical protein [Candidatus Sungbacteria bacterium]